ncbi:hypothetical protein QQ045_015578 [Rhodiola kirilowii]
MESIEIDMNLQQEVWISEVRKVVYDIEDSVDGLMLQIAANSLTVNTKCSSFHSETYTAKDIIPDVKRMKSIIQELFRINPPYQLTPQKDIKERYSTSKSVTTHSSEGFSIMQQVYESLMQKKPADSKKHLIELLMSASPELQVISVVGMGGVGKTTLAEQVYHDAEMKKSFQSHAWIRVPPIFQVKELLKELIRHLYKEDKKSVPDVDGMDIIATMEVMYKFLLNRSYMIVLDDVWSLELWENIRGAFPVGTSGNRVVITTRSADVTSASCTSKHHICYLQPLTADESWALYMKKAFRQGKCPDHLIEISKKILKKCDGLPLAILAVSGVLITMDVESESNEWYKVNHRLEEPFRNTTDIISLGYHNLPYDLRACFLYTSIFHEDHPIAVSKLLRLWIAEGFVKESSTGKTVEEVAQKYLKELLKRSLMEVAETTSDGRVKACRIHDLVRETIIRKSRSENFSFVSKANSRPWPDVVRRLSVHNTIKNVRDEKLHQLRSLLIFDVPDPLSKTTWPSFFTGDCNLLTVLDLQGAALSKFPSVILGMLNLRYLSLRNTKVDNIPSSIGMLKELQTLDLKHTPGTKLPKGILELESLRNLLVYQVKSEPFKFFNNKFGARVPKNIGKLTTLQKLCFVDGGPGMKVVLASLERLTMLRRLGIINLISENCETLGTSLAMLSNLQALSVNCSKGEVLTLPSPTSHPTELRRLYMAGQLNSLPTWIGSHRKLVKIFLKFSKLKDDPLAILEQLPELVHIELLQAYQGSELFFKAGKFTKLKILGIVELTSLKAVKVENKAASNLERLILDGCEELKEVPSGIEHLLKLKELHFVNMPDQLIASIKSDTSSEAKQCSKLYHIPEVTTSTYTEDGTWNIEKLSASWHSGPVGQAARQGLNILREK